MKKNTFDFLILEFQLQNNMTLDLDWGSRKLSSETSLAYLIIIIQLKIVQSRVSDSTNTSRCLVTSLSVYDNLNVSLLWEHHIWWMFTSITHWLIQVSKGVEATLVQLLETGLLHADPHPGNLRYTSSGQIGFVSFLFLSNLNKLCFP